MQGRDVVLDIGTGSGKSLCFDLPVLQNVEGIVLVVSPLSALVLEQAAASPLESIAICKETLTSEGRDTLYESVLRSMTPALGFLSLGRLSGASPLSTLAGRLCAWVGKDRTSDSDRKMAEAWARGTASERLDWG
ncbi:hypothetical protein GGX14DRAFT_579662 [Mycena pura]|uniref:DEAD/DEAH-box helicase domain-containing protein n=1 Tax=Mycena pura TaxID=153505 RepID=A0AAD6UQI7_9AGAR|nr:hypothetical protein GGX14DRAFT_579662 [Mycena pura]